MRDEVVCVPGHRCFKCVWCAWDDARIDYAMAVAVSSRIGQDEPFTFREYFDAYARDWGFWEIDGELRHYRLISEEEWCILKGWV